jgi:short-subunit dehydrogenase
VNVAIVVGASSGLGLEIARFLETGGRAVVGVSRRGETTVRGDASKRETAVRALAEADARGTVDLLVNCAGVGIYGPAGSYDEPGIASLINGNLVATIVFCEVFAPRFKASGGTIVNVLSTAALVGKANETVYCAAKWGARGYSEALRAEAKGTKLRVMSAAPGGMDTPFWPEARPDFMDARDVASTIVDAIARPVFVSEINIIR